MKHINTLLDTSNMLVVLCASALVPLFVLMDDHTAAAVALLLAISRVEVQRKEENERALRDKLADTEKELTRMRAEYVKNLPI